jgi:EAL domain-containing protein (putative c-di-GMP-specific phosphodiesterase class I)
LSWSRLKQEHVGAEDRVVSRRRQWNARLRLDAATLAVLLGITVVYAAIVAAVALASAGSQREDARQGSIDEAKGQLAVVAAFLPRLVAGDAPLRAAELRNLDASWGTLVARTSRRELRIWRADGSLLYRSPGEGGPDALPLAPGSPDRDWSLNPGSGPAGEHLSVYLPVVSGSRTLGIAELSQPTGPLLADEAAQGAHTFWSFVVGAAVLCLVLLPAWLRVARLVARTWDPRRGRLLRRLRRAIEHGELELHYQPKVDLVSGELDGVEALVRWRREGNLVSPGEFLPVVEQSPLIRPLTLFVLDAALRQAREWELAGRPIRVAVNLAAANLVDPRIIEDVSAALARHGVEPASLTLELTETAVLDDEDAATATLVGLAELGVTLSVDDFGTGYSSLSRVSRHPFTELKIDRSFVMELMHQQRPVVATMVRLAKTLGLRVVAEGVEDEASLNALRGLGCDVAQGYLLSRPVPAADLPHAVAHLPALARTAADVRSLLDEVRESLALDAAFVAEFVDTDEIFRWTSGNSGAFDLHEGASQALDDSYCGRLAAGVFPNLLQDARNHPLARELPVTERQGIRAYIGVPLHRPDGTLYGTLCGLARRPRPDLADDEIATLAAFGQRISPLLGSAHLAVSAA